MHPDRPPRFRHPLVGREHLERADVAAARRCARFPAPRRASGLRSPLASAHPARLPPYLDRDRMEITEHWGGWSTLHRVVALAGRRVQLPAIPVSAEPGATDLCGPERHAFRHPLGDTGTRRSDRAHADRAVEAPVRLRRGSTSSSRRLSFRRRWIRRLDAGIGMWPPWPWASWATLHGLVALAGSRDSRPTALQPKPWHSPPRSRSSWIFRHHLPDRGPGALLRCSSAAGHGYRPDRRTEDALLSSGLMMPLPLAQPDQLRPPRGRFSAWLSEDFTPGSNSHSTLGWAGSRTPRTW